MKVPPLNLNPDMNRVGMGLPFSPDLLWRYPLSLATPATPSSPLLDVKNQMPSHLAAVDPRMWTREDVSGFLRWFEREFELPAIDLAKFCMNGKALCLLNKADLADRAPGAGDILHNTLQFLLRDAPHVPQSPLTPHHPLLSPSQLTPGGHPTPWSLMTTDLHNFGHFLHQGGSVTLSPAPSEQSGGSPRHPENGFSNGSSAASVSIYPHHHPHSSTSGSSHSDSEDSTRDSTSPQRSPLPPPHTPTSTSFPAHALASLKHLSDYQRAAAAVASAAAAAAAHTAASQQEEAAVAHHQAQQQLRETSGAADDSVETGTNGRLLWDFLQQLLNDSQQRYSRYIAWKSRDTGVFKIVDPPGLARLWGIQKNHLSMNYDKMSRALRYYYRVNILRKVQGERHCYQFLRNPTELKSVKNISLLRSVPLASLMGKETPSTGGHIAPMDEEGPTDLSMPALHHRYHSILEDEPQNLSVEQDLKIKQEGYAERVFD